MSNLLMRLVFSMASVVFERDSPPTIFFLDIYIYFSYTSFNEGLLQREMMDPFATGSFMLHFTGCCCSRRIGRFGRTFLEHLQNETLNSAEPPFLLFFPSNFSLIKWN